MKSSLSRLKVSVKKSPIHGYGVFADQTIAAGDIIEECYTLLSETKVKEFEKHYFKAMGKFAVPLGNGCIYNHSHSPNAVDKWDKEHHLFLFIAKRSIQKGEEICIFYGEDYFEPHEIKMKKDSFLVKLRRIYPIVGMVSRFMLVTAALYYFLT